MFYVTFGAALYSSICSSVLIPSLPPPTALAVAESRFQHLYKVNFDNMESYMEKKRLRLEQQKSHWSKKRTPGGGSETPGKKRTPGGGNQTPGKKRSKENKVK